MKELQQLVVIEDIQSIPVAYDKRPATDLCCIAVGAIYVLIIAILSISLFNHHHYMQANFPSDSQGRLCGIDNDTKDYPYIYFVNPPNINRRVCVKECPQFGQSSLRCIPTNKIGCRFSKTPGFQVVQYETQPVNSRSGYFCQPKDELLHKQIYQAARLDDRDVLYKSLDTIRFCFFVSLAFCTAYLICVQFFPTVTHYVTLISGCCMMLACAICILLYNSDQSFTKIFGFCVLIILVLIVGTSSIKFHNSLRLHIVFMKYSTLFLKQRPVVLALIPLFFVAIVGWVIVFVLQFTSFWSAGSLSYDSSQDLFYKPEGGGPISFTVFLAIEAVWVFSFLKSSYNFCTSYIAVFWYYGQKVGIVDALKALYCKHLGSVIAGSFMTNFLFTALDFLIDAIKPKVDDDRQGWYHKFYNCCLGRTCKFLDLVREDAITYITLTANPYCNSSRYCEYLCGRSVITDYSQSTSRAFRISGHFLIGGIMTLIALYHNGEISINVIFIVVFVTLMVATLFVSLHCDAAEAIQIIFLADQQFSRRKLNNQFEEINAQTVKSQLTGLQLRPDLVEQVKKERIYQTEQPKK